jgi:hypothetical protein
MELHCLLLETLFTSCRSTIALYNLSRFLPSFFLLGRHIFVPLSAVNSAREVVLWPKFWNAMQLQASCEQVRPLDSTVGVLMRVQVRRGVALGSPVLAPRLTAITRHKCAIDLSQPLGCGTGEDRAGFRG